MPHHSTVVLTALATAGLALASAVSPVPARAATPLAPGATSGFRVRAQVVAADPTTIVVASVGSQSADVGHALDYWRIGTSGDAPAAPFPAGEDLGGDAVPLGGSFAGTTFLTPLDRSSDSGSAWWADLASGSFDEAGQFWRTAIPGGGAWVTSVHGVTTLESSSTAAPDGHVTVLGTLPGIAGPAGTALTADTAGIAVWSGTTLDYYSFATGTAVTLETAGVRASGFGCFSVTSDAVGCAGATQVLRIPLDGGAPQTVAATTPATRASAVAVIPGATAWIDAAGGLFSRPAPPSGATATTTTTLAPGGVSALLSNGTDFVWSRGADVWTATGPADVRRRATVGPLPLQGSRIAATAGRVAWIDNSATTLPLRDRVVVPARAAGRRSRGGLRVGATRTVIASSLAEPVRNSEVIDFQAALDVSGRRTVTVGRAVGALGGEPVGNVIVNDGTRSQVIATGGDGDVAISGTRVLYGKEPTWGTTPEDVYLYDLRTRRTTNLSTHYGIRGRPFGADPSAGTLAGRLFGQYLAYAADGDVRRLDLVTGRSETVAAGRAVGGRVSETAGRTLVAGDWVAWSTPGGTTLRYRNARTLGPIRAVPGYRLRSVSQAGFVASTRHHGTVFRRWATTTDHRLPNSATAVVAGPVVAWLNAAGMPTAETLPAGAAAPQALGAPLAAARVHSGGRWSIDQPVSQQLGTCHVVIRRLRANGSPGAVVARLTCAAAAMAQGDAIATWSAHVAGHPAPAGRYRWQVVASNGSGAAVASTGAPGQPVSGTVTVID